MNTKSIVQLVVAVVIGIALGFFVVTLATQREYPGPSQPVPTEKPLTPGGASATPTRSEPIVEVTSAVPVKMQLRMVTESRSQSFPIANPSNLVFVTGLRLELRFMGELVKSSLKYGNTQITRAVDNDDNDLIQRRPAVPGAPVTASLPVMHPIEYSSPVLGLNPPPRAGGGATSEGTSMVRESLFLKLPARTAQSVKEVEGSVQFLHSQGSAELEFAAVKTKTGQSLKDPVLASSKVTVGVQAAQKSNFVTDVNRAITLRVGGNVDALQAVAFLDKDGKSLFSKKAWSSPGAGVEDWTYLFDNSLTEDVTLKLTVAKGAKLVDVAFKIKDIPLP